MQGELGFFIVTGVERPFGESGPSCCFFSTEFEHLGDARNSRVGVIFLTVPGNPSKVGRRSVDSEFLVVWGVFSDFPDFWDLVGEDGLVVYGATKLLENSMRSSELSRKDLTGDFFEEAEFGRSRAAFVSVLLNLATRAENLLLGVPFAVCLSPRWVLNLGVIGAVLAREDLLDLDVEALGACVSELALDCDIGGLGPVVACLDEGVTGSRISLWLDRGLLLAEIDNSMAHFLSRISCARFGLLSWS